MVLFVTYLGHDIGEECMTEKSKFIRVTACQETHDGFKPIGQATIINSDHIISLDAMEKSEKHCIIRLQNEQKIYVTGSFLEWCNVLNPRMAE